MMHLWMIIWMQRSIEFDLLTTEFHNYHHANSGGLRHQVFFLAKSRKIQGDLTMMAEFPTSGSCSHYFS